MDFRNKNKRSKTRFYRGDDNMWHFERSTITTGSSKDGSNDIKVRARYIQLGGAEQTSYNRSLIRISSR